MFDYKEIVKELHQPLVDLLKTVVSIPAPSNDEYRRTEYVLNYLKQFFNFAYKDEVGNVILKFENPGKPKVIWSAHLDTVFPIETPLIPKEIDGRLYCPGVGDCTAHVCFLMLLAKYIKEHDIKFPNYEFWIVFTVGEEGLGNLYGIKNVMKNVNPKEFYNFITLDCNYTAIATSAVGSVRYKISVKTQGGHSFNHYGRKNAIIFASKMIQALTSIDLYNDENIKTTCNVGVISGGTSVNSIPGYCEFLYEYRSNSKSVIDNLDKEFIKIFNSLKEDDVEINYEVIGRRDASGDINPILQKDLVDRGIDAIYKVTGKKVKGSPHSMDYNVPMSLGIPSIGIGVYDKGASHQIGENISIDSLKNGIEILFRFFEYYTK